MKSAITTKADVLFVMKCAYKEDLSTEYSFRTLVFDRIRRKKPKLSNKQVDVIALIITQVWDENYVLIGKMPDYGIDQIYGFCKYDWKMSCKYADLDIKQAYAKYLIKRSAEENDMQYIDYLNIVFKAELLEQSITLNEPIEALEV